MTILETREIYKTYLAGLEPVEAVRGVNLSVKTGEFVAIMGPSGCGKSTLLHLCGAMDRPTSGRIELEGRSLQDLDEDQLTELRRGRVGFVFQFFNLLPTLTALENIALPLLLAGKGSTEAERRARTLAERVGMSHRSGHYPQQLSGGEMQRAAMARAIVHSPALLVADEPTGNLDSDNGSKILGLLAELNRETNVAILLATHDPDIAAAAHRTIRMRDGCFESAGKVDPVAPL